MKLLLNPYSLIIRENASCHFVFSDLSDKLEIALTSSQNDLLDHLKSGESIEQDELENVFTQNVIKLLVEKGVLVENAVDTSSIFSRTNAFFNSFNMPEARSRLQNSNVLILGCGGIGTHIAWHMMSIGVGKLTLLDFDVVEESNFNRQILFDRNDIGKYKVDVLKEKLLKINPYIEISTIRMKISSAEEMKEICTKEKYNLIIKSLDSPNEVSSWLDSVCKQYKLPYITGITMRDTALIGPSFVPEVSEIGWSDLLPVNSGSQREHGIAPSLGVILYNISAEIAVEAVKILTGYGNLKYSGKIVFRNIFTNQEQVIGKNEERELEANNKKTELPASNQGLVLGLILVTVVTGFGLRNTVFLPIAFLLALVLPLYLYKNKKDVMMCSFLAATVFSFISSLIGIRKVTFFFDSMEIVQIFLILVIMFGAFSIAILSMCTIVYIISDRKNIESKMSNRS